MKISPIAVGVLAALFPAVAVPLHAQEKQSFTANVVPLKYPAPRTWDDYGLGWPLPITVNLIQWSDASTILKRQGSFEGDLTAAVRGLRRENAVGYVVPPGNLAWAATMGTGRDPSWRVVLAWSGDSTAGRVVRLVTDRPLTVFAQRTSDRGPKNWSGRVGAIELVLDGRGRGEGVLVPFAKVAFDGEGGFTIEAPREEHGAYKLIGVKAWER